MGTELTTEKASPILRPTMMGQHWTSKLAILQNKMGLDRDQLGRGSFAKADAPDPATRAELEGRQRMLRSHMVAISHDDLDEMLASFFLGYSSMRNITTEAFDKALDEYTKVLAGLPAWALDAALTNAVDGGTDPRYVPNAAELRWKAAAEMRVFEKELHDIATILEAHIAGDPAETPEERAAAVDRYWTQGARLTVSVGGGESEQLARQEREEAARRETMEANNRLMRRWQEQTGIDPAKTVHSPYLLGLYGLMGAYAPDRYAEDREGKNGHIADEPDRSRTA